MAATAMIHVRVDDEIKTQATETLAMMGLSVSDAVRVFLKRVVVEQAMPFEIRVPNIETRAAMDEADEIVRARCARFANSQKMFDVLEK
jgi:DNA-damage-inducible protein J